jgi:hypothetical protein
MVARTQGIIKNQGTTWVLVQLCKGVTDKGSRACCLMYQPRPSPSVASRVGANPGVSTHWGVMLVLRWLPVKCHRRRFELRTKARIIGIWVITWDDIYLLYWGGAGTSGRDPAGAICISAPLRAASSLALRPSTWRMMPRDLGKLMSLTRRIFKSEPIGYFWMIQRIYIGELRHSPACSDQH